MAPEFIAALVTAGTLWVGQAGAFVWWASKITTLVSGLTTGQSDMREAMKIITTSIAVAGGDAVDTPAGRQVLSEIQYLKDRIKTLEARVS